VGLATQRGFYFLYPILVEKKVKISLFITFTIPLLLLFIIIIIISVKIDFRVKTDLSNITQPRKGSKLVIEPFT